MNSDTLLIEQLRQGETKAVHELYQLTFRYCASHITSHGGTVENAREIFQEVLVVLFNKLQDPKFNIERSLKSYLYVITKNLWSNYLKKETKTGLRLIIDEEEKPQLVEEDPQALEKKKEQEQLLLRLEQLLSQHSEDCKKLLKLFFYEKKKYREVANIMGYQESYIRKKKKKCIDTLRQRFEQIKDN